MQHGDEEIQREKRRISKMLLTDHYDEAKTLSRRAMVCVLLMLAHSTYLLYIQIPQSNEVDLDSKINKIRRDDQKRLKRQEEIRRDRQRYG